MVVGEMSKAHSASKVFLVIVCSCLVLCLSLLRADASLHAQLHKGAASPDHECAVTTFAKGQAQQFTVVPHCPAPEAGRLIHVALTEPAPGSKQPLLLPPSCGPPVARQ